MQSEPNYSTNLRERVFSMLQTFRGTDCKFLVGTEVQKEMEGHKVILASASPVFNAMFYGEMAESQAIIPMPDIQPITFQAMLEYIYTDDIKLRSLDEAINLYYAANKYIVTNLKKICITYIESILTKENVCRVYEFGSMFEEENLRYKCLALIKDKENTTDFLANHLRSNKNLENIKLSTLVTIFSIEQFTTLNAAFFFELAEKYVMVQKKRILRSNNSETASELSIHKSLESSILKDMVVLNEKSKTEDNKEILEESNGQDKGTVSSVKGSKKEPNVRPLLKKIHFLTLTPKQFAEGPAKSELLTMEEKYAILMNIASNKTKIPMPSGFSKYRRDANAYDDDEYKVHI